MARARCEGHRCRIHYLEGPEVDQTVRQAFLRAYSGSQANCSGAVPLLHMVVHAVRASCRSHG